jgi:hypothetical protein
VSGQNSTYLGTSASPLLLAMTLLISERPISSPMHAASLRRSSCSRQSILSDILRCYKAVVVALERSSLRLEIRTQAVDSTV